jgi:hypothetical protein
MPTTSPSAPSNRTLLGLRSFCAVGVKASPRSADILDMDTKRAPSGRLLQTNALTVIVAIMLGVLVLDRVEQRGIHGSGQAALASGQPESGGSLISAADQRKQIIAEIRVISQRLDAIDKRLAKPIQVKVVEMPVQKEKAAAPGN